MRRCTHLFVPVLLLFVSALSTWGQEPQEIAGGHFEWKGKKYELTPEEIERHLAVVKPLNPGIPFSKQLHLAFSRAIRIACAEAEGIEFDEEGFQEWMRQRHLSLRTALAAQSDRAAALDAWIKERGFENIAAYEAACREEFLGELFERTQFPEVKTDEAAIRKKFDEIYSAYEVSALVFAPDCLTNYEPRDIEKEEHRKLFISWWNSLSDADKIRLDDRDHPAIEAEVLYFRFADKSVAELKEFFERERPEIGGSFKELTKKYECGPEQVYKMAARWQQQRDGTMARWNAELPAELNNNEAFAKIQPHLERIWRLIKYAGEIWQELRNSKTPVDMKKVARERGMTYRYFPMTPTRLLFSDKILPGDHPLYLRKIKPGSIYRYTGSSANASSIYYTDGVVDQPGIHASIWRMIAAEEMQVRKPEEVLDTAWPTFEEANRWRIAYARANHVRDELEKLVTQHLKEKEKDGKLDPAERAQAEVDFVKQHFGTFFDPGTKNKLDHSRILSNLFIRPEDGLDASPVLNGRLGVRVENYLKIGWNKIVGGSSASLVEGQIIPMAISNEHRVGLLTRIDKIHKPTDHRWKVDVAGRKIAQDRLERGALAKRANDVRLAYAFPNNLRKFKIKAPQYERIMSEALLGKMNPGTKTKKK